jgi:hypothetical protein
MAIMLAMYVGCKEIYLLGCDHDWFVTGKYLYFFDRRHIDWKDSHVAKDGTIEATLDEQLPSVGRLWDQYKALWRIAQANKIKSSTRQPEERSTCFRDFHWKRLCGDQTPIKMLLAS